MPLKEDEKGGFLWNSFTNQPKGQKINLYTTAQWKENFTAFAATLLKMADNQKLDSGSLHKALDLVLKNSQDKIAYLPIGAYQASLDGKSVWIITVRWEYPSMGKDGAAVELGHIRAFAFDQERLNQVGFVTCL